MRSEARAGSTSQHGRVGPQGAAVDIVCLANARCRLSSARWGQPEQDRRRDSGYGGSMSADRSSPRSTFDLLSATGVLGFFTQFEATEIVAFPPAAATPVNVFTIFVAEERQGPLPSKRFLTATGPVTLPALPDWKFGALRYHMTAPALGEALAGLTAARSWRPSGSVLDVGSTRAVPVQFVPPDSFRPVPWNRVLKNNFHGGSHVMEWATADAKRLGVLSEMPQRLKQLAALVRSLVPIDLEGLADRIGSIVVQFPVTVAVMGFGRSGDDGLIGEVAWHHRATPRALRVNCDFSFDHVVPGFVSADVMSGRYSLPVRADRGTHRVFLWDPANSLLLAASGEAVFTNTIMLNLQPLSPEPRVFKVPVEGGTLVEHRVKVVATSMPSIIGSSESDDTGGATQQRLYLEDTARLAAERRFVQYKPENGTQLTERERGLNDLRRLIDDHGRTGCWLWDPYLAADDILQTLFYCQYSGSDLRALSAARTHRENNASKADFVIRERARLEAAKGNEHGLRLEYRASIGDRGWSFHDRFLIFPRVDEGALAWSLGTSVNSFGKAHHILQRVDDGQRIADAFDELWSRLATPADLVWKSP